MIDFSKPFVQQLDLIQRIHQLHLSFGIKAFSLYAFHRITLILELTPGFHDFLCMAHIPEWVIVATGTRFAHVVVLLRVGFHGYLGVAPTAFEVKAVDLDAKVVLI